MRLYLVRHGEPVSKEVDPQQPLSPQGMEDVRRVARFLAGAGVGAGKIYHSSKKRAEQTAGLIAEGLGATDALEQMSGIKPMDPVTPLAQALTHWTTDRMVVGHLPFMTKLTSLLVAGDEASVAVAFHTSSVVCLEAGQDREDPWMLVWMIEPGLLPETKA